MIQLFKKYLSQKRPKATYKETQNIDEFFFFEENGLTYIFSSFPNNSYYFRIVLPDIYTLPSEESERMKFYKMIDSFNQKYMVAKSIVVNNELWISAETFKFSNENIDDLFDNMIQVLIVVYNEYKKILSNTNTDESKK